MSNAPAHAAPTESLDANVEELLKQVESGAAEIARTLGAGLEPERAQGGHEPSDSSAKQPSASQTASAAAPSETSDAGSLDEAVGTALEEAKAIAGVAAAAPAAVQASPDTPAASPASPPTSFSSPAQTVQAIDAALAAKVAATVAVEDEFNDPAAMGNDSTSDAGVASQSAASASPPPGAATIAHQSDDEDPPPVDKPDDHSAVAVAAHAASPAASANPAAMTARAPDGGVLNSVILKLAGLPATTRQTVGWVALGTLFWAAVVWAWALLFMGGPPTPSTDHKGAKQLMAGDSAPSNEQPAAAPPSHAAPPSAASHETHGSH